MSFLPINEANQQAPTGQTTNAPIAGAPPQTSGSAGTSPSAPKGASAGSPTQFGSSASKLGDYLSANAPQITQQADTIVGGLNQQYENVSKGIQKAAADFGNQVQTGYTPNDQGLVQQAIQNIPGFVSDPNNVQAFQNQYNNQYTGPLAFEGTSPYADIQNQVSQAAQQGNLLGSEAGLASYLQGTGTNPSRAAATLDSLLLRGNPEAQQTVQAAANQLGGLTNQLQSATAGANAQVPIAQQQAQQNQNQTQSAINDYLQQFNNQLQQGLTTAQSQRDTQNSQLFSIEQKLSNNQPLTDQEAQAIGVTKSDIDKLLGERQLFAKNWGVALPALGNYASFDPITMPYTLAGASNQQQFQTDQALKTLLGQNYNPQFTPDQASQIGSLQNVQLQQADPKQLAWDLLDALQKGSTNVNVNGGRLQSFANDWDSLASLIGDPRYLSTKDMNNNVDWTLFNNPILPFNSPIV